MNTPPSENMGSCRSSRSRCGWKAGAVAVAMGWALVSGASAGTDLTFAWEPNTEPDLAGYIVHYGLASGLYTEALDVGEATTARVISLVAGSTYYFAVTAYNPVGVESPASNEISFTVPSPPSPVTLITQSLDPADFGFVGGDFPPDATALAVRSPLCLEDGSCEFLVQALDASRVTIYVSTDLVSWSVLREVANPTGILLVRDFDAIGVPQRFYSISEASVEEDPVAAAAAAPTTPARARKSYRRD